MTSCDYKGNVYLICLIGLVVIIATGSSVCAQNLFDNRIDYSLDVASEYEWLPVKCLSIDINHDSHDDLAILNGEFGDVLTEEFSLVVTFRNNGQGTFEQGEIYHVGSRPYVLDICGGLINDDEYKDLTGILNCLRAL